MTTKFPVALDTFVNPGPATKIDGGGDKNLAHDVQHVNLNDAVAALQKFIGINGSTDVNSLQYKLANGLAQGPVGPTGPQGPAGLQGIQGPAGIVSTDVNALGSFICANTGPIHFNINSTCTMCYVNTISWSRTVNTSNGSITDEVCYSPSNVVASANYSSGVVYLSGTWRYVGYSGLRTSEVGYPNGTGGTAYFTMSMGYGLFQRIA